ncbi:SRPBCC family protein [Streptomyces erythrochromogenes]|uniref:SRPBCC family protein n=1 Tax=Streptomyces erythrochromogenes TaxID=285574 RepID=UPI003863AE65|nr:SRPBCC family protein [Streptomyces erythrochromogenes]
MDSAAWQTPPPVAVGSRIAFTARFLGRRLAYTYEVTAYEPGRRLVMRTAEGTFPMETTYTWESYGDGSGHTRMTLRNRGEPRGFASLAAPAMTAAMRRAQNKDLVRLKSLLERTA